MNGKLIAIAGLSMAGTAFAIHQMNATTTIVTAPTATHGRAYQQPATGTANAPTDSPTASADGQPPVTVANPPADPNANPADPNANPPVDPNANPPADQNQAAAPPALSGPVPPVAPPKSTVQPPPAGNSGHGQPAPKGTAPQTLSIPLTAMPQGTAQLSINPANHEVVVNLQMTGLTPGSTHAVHFAAGACAAEPTRASYVFRDVAADNMGRESDRLQTLGYMGGTLPTNSHIAVFVGGSAHNDAGPGPLAGMPLACAELPGGATSAQLTLVPQSNAGSPMGGRATLTYDAGMHRLTVHVNATGLVANSTHAAHIHSGSCAAQGPVALVLPDLTANGAGAIDQTVTINNVMTPPVAAGYLNIHMGSSADILANGTPTLSFRPLLCGDIRA